MQAIAFWILVVFYALVFVGAFLIHNKPREGNYDGSLIITTNGAIILLWLIATGSVK